MSKLMPALLGAALSSGSGGGSDLEPIIITAESNTTINGYQVPALTSENIQAIYNGIVAGKEVVVTDATENMHFKVNQADTVSDEIFISYVYFDVMLLQYDENGNITYKEIESLPSGGTIGQVLKKLSNEDYDTEWGDMTDIPLYWYQANVNFFTSTFSFEITDPGVLDFVAKHKNDFNAMLCISNNLQTRNSSMVLIPIINQNTIGIIIPITNSSGDSTCFTKREIRLVKSWIGSSSVLSKITVSNGSYAGWGTVEVPYKNMVLTRDNTGSYTPTSNYHPATKKYVDDSIASAITNAIEGSY